MDQEVNRVRLAFLVGFRDEDMVLEHGAHRIGFDKVGLLGCPEPGRLDLDAEEDYLAEVAVHNGAHEEPYGFEAPGARLMGSNGRPHSETAGMLNQEQYALILPGSSWIL